MPFEYEGQHKLNIARQMAEDICKIADAVLPVNNKLIMRSFPKNIAMNDVYNRINDMFGDLIRCISEMTDTDIVTSSDFADIKTVLAESGKFFYGTGKSTKQEGIMAAYKRAINNPFLEYSIEGATRCIVHITGNENMTTAEISAVVDPISEIAGKDAIILHGFSIGESGGFIVALLASFKN
jgi:cell division protein FtsZ